MAPAQSPCAHWSLCVEGVVIQRAQSREDHRCCDRQGPARVHHRPQCSQFAGTRVSGDVATEQCAFAPREVGVIAGVEGMCKSHKEIQCQSLPFCLPVSKKRACVWIGSEARAVISCHLQRGHPQSVPLLLHLFVTTQISWLRTGDQSQQT